ncbi:hypothetical protein CK203_020078 [Vitis vinifera]|uniref:Uncharacterized protein n=1 Tax=Vitis vinifera TaxID=29760 RepID=A0A438J832_VITVI|nr:hypothetical protein CK203_020078 [Vitis vinifera]
MFPTGTASWREGCGSTDWDGIVRSLAKAQHGQKSRCHRCSISCQELPPPQYFPKESSIKPMDSFLPSDAIPMIDISLLSSSSLSSKGDDELQKLKLALTSWCCFEKFMSHVSTYSLLHGGRPKRLCYPQAHMSRVYRIMPKEHISGQRLDDLFFHH